MGLTGRHRRGAGLPPLVLAILAGLALRAGPGPAAAAPFETPAETLGERPAPAPVGTRLGAAPAGATRVELLALGGFDPVSYFLPGGPAAGAARFEWSWGGRVWRFASAANRTAFREAPEAYAPRLGGYDALGVLDRRLVDPDPTVFAVIGERLYLFRDPARRARMLAEPGLAREAEAVWPGLGGLTDGRLQE